MTPRSLAVTSMLLLGFWSPAAWAQDVPGRTVERSIVQDPATPRDARVQSEVVDETVRRDGGTSQRTRSVFVTDANGRRRLVSTMEEQRTTRPDGSHEIVRDFVELDVNGRSVPTRREREERVARDNGVFVTEIEVTEPSINGRGFVATERIEQRERRVGDQVVERESTTYADPTGRGRWDVTEQRVMTRAVAGGGADAVELIYRRDSSGNLAPSERIVSREWTAGGRDYRTEEIYGRDVNNGGALTRRPVQQVDIAQTTRSDGGTEMTRTVSERQGDRLQVVEQVVERAVPDGRGGSVIEQDIQRAVVSGRLETVMTGGRQESR